MFTGLTEDICRQAWVITLPAVEAAAEQGVINKRAGTLVVLEPYTGEILYLVRVDPNHPDAVRYDEIAETKARDSWAMGLSSREVQQRAPHLYREGMTKWGGSVVQDRLVVAFSGVQAVFDEAIAGMVLAWIVGICRNEMTKPDGVMAAPGSFIGG